MKTSTTAVLLLIATILATVFAGAAHAAAGSRSDELAVWQAMLEDIARDNASRPYKLLFFKSDFETADRVASSLTDPSRREYAETCGLPAAGVKALVEEMKTMNSSTLEIDETVADAVGLKVGRKKNRRARYVALSRVVFDPGSQSAWVAIDLSGTTGAIMRLDKIDGVWTRSFRCGGWLQPGD